MKNFNKVYQLETVNFDFIVKEYNKKVPLLFIHPENGEPHLFHRNGFEWYDKNKVPQSDTFKKQVYAAFDECQQYLDNNPYLFDDDSNLKFTKEYFS